MNAPLQIPAEHYSESRALARELHDCAYDIELPDDDFMAGWAADFRDTITLRTNNTYDLATSLWACAALDSQYSHPWTRAMGEEIYREIQKRDVTNEGAGTMRQIAHACLWFDLSYGFDIPPESHTRSKTQMKIRDAFERSCFYPDEQPLHIDTLNHDVNLSFTRNNSLLLVKLDGPTHMREDAQGKVIGYNGRTVFQTALITKFLTNAILLRMPYPAQNIFLQSIDYDQDIVVEMIKRRSANTAPGAYSFNYTRSQLPFIEPLKPDFD